MRAEAPAAVRPSALVSIGIPTFDRPAGLRRTIDDCRKQTYDTIEMIICDNASTDPEVAEVLRHSVASDSRITCHRSAENRGPVANFGSALQRANGEFFMWAADDDRREDWVVETLVRRMQSDPAIVCACVEAQYFADDRSFAPFAEGRSFHVTAEASCTDRVGQMIWHNYGNLVYGLFRTEVAREAFPFFGMNEVAFLLKVASLGNISVTDRVGLYKRASEPVVAQARWEMDGGRLPSRKAFSYSVPRHALSVGKYHWQALQPMLACISSLRLSRTSRLRLKLAASSAIALHWTSLVLGWKPRRGTR
jgi:glycosyltransferase involved in cell wall biosynthesis